MAVILDNKTPRSPSVFRPDALLREARRQKAIPFEEVPRVCVLDPDGDLVRVLRESGSATRFSGWPCYHTELDTFPLGRHKAGIIGRVVGAPFAVLIAEELFASGCRLLVSLTSAGQITPAGKPPYFVVIDRALRDEGTSYHYAAPAEFADANAELAAALYTFARVANVQVLCLAHVTNTMAQAGADFEKGEADGTRDALAVLEAVVSALETPIA